MYGAERIKAERQRQIEYCNHTLKHDDDHDTEALVKNAAVIALNGTDCFVEDIDGPVNEDWFGVLEKHHSNRIRCLEIAGALIAAEIDRLLREQEATDGSDR